MRTSSTRVDRRRARVDGYHPIGGLVCGCHRTIQRPARARSLRSDRHVHRGRRPERALPTADHQLAQWAFDAWQRATGPTLQLTPMPEASARVRVYRAGPQSGQYGEMRSLQVNGKVGAAVYIRPDTMSLGPDIHALATTDPLFRDTVIYLTCVHELGHAFGLRTPRPSATPCTPSSTAAISSINFSRYRRQLKSRDDIALISGMSEGDVTGIRTLYPAVR